MDKLDEMQNNFANEEEVDVDFNLVDESL